MGIMVRVLMLVACVPPLLPPGFCICRVGGWGCVAPTGQAQVAGGQKIKPALGKIGCCANRDCTGDHAGRPASTPGESKSRPGPAPRDDLHMPGCPAAPGADAFKWVEAAQSFAQTLPPIELRTSLPLDAAAPLAVRPVPPAANWPSSPPIYLCDCSLVI